MENMEWIKLSLCGQQTDVELLTAIISMIDSGVMIEDYSDITTDGLYGALIDESILNADKTRVTVSVFLSADRSLAEAKAFLTERLSASGLSATVTTEGMREEDWAETWKKYYHPISVGKLTVVPAWEEYTPKGDERIIRMDPGMAFGTGTHETTRLVMSLLSDEGKLDPFVLHICYLFYSFCKSSSIWSLSSSKDANFCSSLKKERKDTVIVRP